MLPSNQLETDFEIEEQPSKTYKIVGDRLIGFIDGKDAIQQTSRLTLGVERYQYLIYSWNYGTELADLFGQPKSFVYSEIKRRITEALMQDDRITDVTGFEFEQKKNAVHVTFTVHTTSGDYTEGVDINV